jgi:hypothetical protein
MPVHPNYMKLAHFAILHEYDTMPCICKHGKRLKINKDSIAAHSAEPSIKNNLAP